MHNMYVYQESYAREEAGLADAPTTCCSPPPPPLISLSRIASTLSRLMLVLLRPMRMLTSLSRIAMELSRPRWQR